MHAVAAFFAGIIAFVSGFFAPTVASNSPVNVQTTQPAAAAATQTEITGDPFNDPTAASVVAAALAAAPSPAFSPPQAQTVINQPVIERIIERIVPQGAGSISTETLAAILSDFEQSISNRIAALNPPKATIPEQVAAAGNSASYYFVPASQRIDQLSNVTVSRVSGLTDGDIPDGITASNYLPLSGGTLTGTLSGTDLTLSGALTAGALNVTSIASAGALTGPYFTATSTTATSSFAGGLTVTNGSFSILQNGNVGIGTAAPSIAGVNSNSRVLSIVGDGTLVNARGVLELANPRASGSLAANDTAGSAFFVMSNNSGNPYIAGILGSLSGSGGANGFGGKLQFQTKVDNAASSATTKMVLDQNGNVGIGTTTPWGKLSITGSGTGTGLAFAVADSANTPRFVIQDNGNVGIGTTTPYSKLHTVIGNSTAKGVLLSTSDWIFGTAGSGVLIKTGADTGNTYTEIDAVQSGAGSGGTLVLNNNSGNVGIGTTTPWGKLSVQATDNSSAPQLVVASSTATSLFVGANGKVGIGTTTPAKLLDIYGAAAGLSIDASSGNPSVIFKRNSATDATIATAQAAGQVITGSATGDLAIRSESHSILFSTNSGTTAHVAISTTGNVGIGTTSPAALLDVNGFSRFGAGTARINLGTSMGTSESGLGITYGSYAANTAALQAESQGVGFRNLLLNPSGGNVGIGTTTPQAKLSVSNTTGGSALDLDFSSSVYGIRFQRNGQDMGSIYKNVSGPLNFSSYATQGTTADFSFMGGNIGIGTTTPNAQLAINTGVTEAMRLSGLTAGRGIFADNGASSGIFSLTRQDTVATGDLSIAAFGGIGFKGGSTAYNNAVSSGYAMYLNSSGNVGIGTTTPQQKLAVSSSGDTRLVIDSSGSGSQSILSFQNQGAAKFEIRNQPSGGTQFLSVGRYGGNDLNVDNNGNVGIGTTTPNSQLQIKNATNQETQIGGTAGAYDNSTYFTDLFRVDSAINFSRSTDGAFLNSIFGYETAGLAENNLGLVARHDIKFVVGATADRGMVIKSTGNVGIGTTSPAAKLEVSSSGSGNPVSFYMDGDRGLLNAQAGNIGFRNKSTNIASIDGYTGATGGSINYGQLVFSTANSGSLIERMRITESGNVGIGTTSPTNKLEVAGNTFLGGTITGTSTLALTGTTGTTTIATGQGFTIGGSQFVVQQGSGNVGIGTTTPNAKLDIFTNTSAIQKFTRNGNVFGYEIGYSPEIGLYDYNNSKYIWNYDVASLVFLPAGGNVGIGTTTPGGILEVGNTSSSGIIANFTNGNSAATAYTELGVRNGYTVGNNADALRLLTFSTGWTTTGGFVQDGAALEAGANLSGGLSMVARNSAGVLRFYTGGQADSNERMRITSTGNVGIGTTSLSARMTISTSNSEVAAFNSDSVNGGYIDWNNGGSTIGFAGAALPLAEAGFSASDFSIRARNNLLFISNGGISNRYMMWTNAGNLGIGTTSPTAQLSTTGTVRFSNFGAGTLTTDASGNLSVSSDERLKNIDGEFTRGLADIVKLNPVSYHWNESSGLDTATQYAGFSAQNVQQAIPEAVGSSTNGYLTLQDRPLIATVVNAIKELAQQVSDLAERVVTKELTFVRAEGDDLMLNHQLCIRDGVADSNPICLTKSQVAAVLAATGQAAGSPSASAPAGMLQAPVIELNGNASSTIELDQTYNDLGARIVAPESDLNLGIVVLLDGATTTAVSIDTSAPGEHTILYTVTSPTTGLTGTIMRTVTVSSAEELTVPAEEDTNPFNAPDPANDNASSTHVLIAS